jgi:carboxypeptidase PM20D1
MSNIWLFSPLLLRVFSSVAATASIVRTTTAITVFKSNGNKSNVLPSEAYALINHRIHPKDNIAKVLAKFDSCICICMLCVCSVLVIHIYYVD